MIGVQGFGLTRRWLGVLLALALVVQGAAGFAGSAGAAEAAVASPSREDVKTALGKLQSLYGAATVAPSDWVAFGMARSGKPLAADYKKVAEKAVSDGSLRLATDYARVALALNASGSDPTSVGTGKVNLLEKLVGIEKMTSQGPNALAYGLLAIDAAGYEPGKDAKWTRDALIQWLVDNRSESGGWSLSAGKSDADVTGIVLTALAPYVDRAEVRAAVDAALAWMSAAQLKSGGFAALGQPESSETTAQALIALTALDIDPANDTRFQKDGVSALARLLQFRQADGRFAHAVGGKADAMATYYALLGLSAVDRWQDGLPGLYAGLGNVTALRGYSVVVSGLNGQLASGTAGGRTALEALVGVLKSKGTAYTIERHAALGAYLTGVGSLTNSQLGGYDGWNFAVKRGGKWVTIMEGMATFQLLAGDELFVYYGDLSTQLIHAVTFEPAQPRAGQPVTVKVERETYDWEKGETIVTPAANATVEIGAQIAATDENGAVTLRALPQGEQAVLVTGYESGKAPTYVAWESKVTVESYTKRVTVRVEGDTGVIASGLSHGGYALEAIEALLKAKGVKYNVQKLDWGSYIDSIGGIDSGKYGGYDGWYFAVNRDGKWFSPSSGADTFLLADGDELLVYYAGGETKLAESVVATPANPKPGQDVTVKVTYRPVNPETFELEPAKPLVGATVKAGTSTAVTDANGNAVLKGLKEGLYTLEVTGYKSGAVPEIARIAQPLAVSASYSDEKAIAAWALSSVRIARASGAMLGVGDSAAAAFKPQQATTRAEFVAALARVLGLSAASGKTAFTDVPAGAWYADEVAAAVKAGIVSGVSKTKFAPNATLTREQAALLLTRALKLKGEDVTPLKDLSQVSSGAGGAVQAVLSTSWMTAYAGKFSPKASLTREQAATIAARIVVANR